MRATSPGPPQALLRWGWPVVAAATLAHGVCVPLCRGQRFVLCLVDLQALLGLENGLVRPVLAVSTASGKGGGHGDPPGPASWWTMRARVPQGSTSSLWLIADGVSAWGGRALHPSREALLSSSEVQGGTWAGKGRRTPHGPQRHPHPQPWGRDDTPLMTPGQGHCQTKGMEGREWGRPGSGRMDGVEGDRSPSSGTACAKEQDFIHPFIP